MNQYKSKDIYEITGLSRSQVNDYSDVILPFAYETEGMHKVYDDSSLIKFKKVAIYKAYGISRKDIKHYISHGTSVQKVLEKQIKTLQKQTKKSERQIKELSALVKCDFEKLFDQKNNENFREIFETE